MAETRGTKTSSKEFGLVSNYRFGYRNREDITMLNPGIMVEGSQNVLTNVYGRVGVVKGYQLDGPSSAIVAPIKSAYDYEMHTGPIRNLRAGFLTTTNDGKLQYRYVDSSGTVTWRDLLTGLTSVDFNFTDYWDTTNLVSMVLMVNGASSITEWTGGVTTVASGTATTITKEGTTSWAEEGFYTTGTHKVTIGGVEYTATGGWGTTTLTGVTPSAAAIVAGDIAHQTPETTLNSSITGLPATFANSIISILKNQVYVGSLVNRTVYISEQNNYKSYSFSNPRIVGQGAIITLDACPIGFAPQEDAMYISAGKDQWYQTQIQQTQTTTTVLESLTIQRLKTTTQQGAQSQAFISKIRNSVVYLSNEPFVNTLGRVDNVVLTPQITDISYSIVNDMNSYDFTDGCIFYWRNFCFVAVPRHSLIRIYNMTNSQPDENGNVVYYWEAPIGYPVSRFSIVDGDLYGHSYQTSESYKLFTGYNFNGNPIDARAVFSFQNFGSRTDLKSFNDFYVEGYISGNTTITCDRQFDIDGCATTQSFSLVGTDTQLVCIGSDDNSLGKKHLGENPLGADLATESAGSLPPKFRGIFTSDRVPFFEMQTTIRSVGIDYQWELIAFGPRVMIATEGPTHITK